MKKLLVLFALLAVAGYAFAQTSITHPSLASPVVINDDDSNDGDTTNDDTVVADGEVYPISVGDIFRLTVVGTAIEVGVGSTSYYDVGQDMYFGDELPNNAAEDATAGDSLGNDVDGAANTNIPEKYRNMARFAGPVYNDHLVFLTQNRGLRLKCDLNIDGTITEMRTPGDDVTGGYPTPTAFDGVDGFADLWDGSNDGPIHVTVLPWYEGTEIATSDLDALLAYDGTEGHPSAISDTNETLTLYDQTNDYVGTSDGFDVITALDFVSLNVEAGSGTNDSYAGTVSWTMSGT